jgi:PAS domain S-box-containing protein
VRNRDGRAFLFGSLRIRLTLILIGLAISPLVLVGAIVGQSSYDGLVQQSLAMQGEVVARVGSEIRAFVEGRENELLLLNKVQGLEVRGRAEQRSLLSNLLLYQQVYQELTLLDAQGQELVRVSRSGVVVEADLQDRSTEDEFLSPVRDRETYFGTVRFDQTIREPLITLAVPLIDLRSDEVAAVLVADLRFEPVWSLLAETDMPHGRDVYVVDQAGQVVAHRNPTIVLRGTTVDLSGVNGRAKGLSGVNVIVARDTLRFGEQMLVVVAEQSISSALELAARTLRVAVGITLAALVLAAVLGVFAARQIVRPIEDLSTSAQAISNGDFSGRVQVSSRDEIYDLAQAFNSMSRQLEQLLTGLEQEITERRQAEAALRESEARFRSLVEHSPDGIVLTDEAGNVLEWNRGAEQIIGLTPAETVGRPLIDAQFQVALERLRTGPNYDRVREMYAQLFKTGDAPWLRGQQEVEIQRPDGARRTIQTLVFPIQTARGYRAGSIIRDFTERRRAEQALRELNEELEQRVQERTAELESFVYSVSHDLRSPLRAMSGFSHILLQEHAPQLSDDAQRYLTMVRDNAVQMGRLIDDLLAFSRLGRRSLEKRTVNPGQLARQVMEELRPAHEDRQVELTIDDLPSCHADPNLLRQVYANLLSNALKFTAHREVAQIEVGCLQEGEEQVYFVRDNGVGFDMQYADKLFGVFQRLHRATEYEGTGVGLAIVQRIVHRHGGRVWAEAAPEEGATFYFTLAGSDQ